MNSKDRLALAEWTVNEAKRNGASEASVDIAKNRNIEIEYRDGNLDQLNEATSNGLSLTVYAEGKYSSNSTNDLRKETLGRFVKESVAMTRYLAEDPFRGLPDPKFYQDRSTAKLQLYDSAYESLASDKRIAVAKEIEALTHQKSSEVLTCTAYFSDTLSQTVKVNSNGFQGETRETSFGSGVSLTVKDGDRGRPSDWAWASAKFLEDLHSPAEYADTAFKRTMQKIGQKKLASGVYDMIVDNRSASRLLGGLYGPMQGSTLQQKQSFLEGKIGQKIASEKLTMIDDPFVVRGLSSGHFDGEGMSTKRRVMIEKGVLKNYYIDTYYGKKLDMTPTTGGSSNLTFEKGDKSLEELIAGVTKGILVTSFVGGNNNSTTGDFSYGIIGMLIENGKLTQPVNEMNVSGNSGELWGKLVEMGNDPYVYSGWRRPSMLFEGVHFAGI